MHILKHYTGISCQGRDNNNNNVIITIIIIAICISQIHQNNNYLKQVCNQMITFYFL